MRVLSVTSEIYPVIKTGGLADVAGALPAAQRAADVVGQRPVLDLPDLFGGPARVLAGPAAGLALFCLDAPHLFGRPGNPYVGPDGADWPDNLQRFAALSRVAAMLGMGAVPGWVPDVVHAHDWQAGLAPAYLHFGGGPRPGARPDAACSAALFRRRRRRRRMRGSTSIIPMTARSDMG